MDILAILFVLGIFLSPPIALLVLRKRLKNLEHKVSTLQERLIKLESRSASAMENPCLTDPVQESEAVIISPPERSETISLSSKKEIQNKVSFNKKPLSVLSRLEKQFLNNWTGLLGAIIVVLGAGFLSIYAALKMTEFYRFLLLLVLAALPGGLYFLLKQRERWIRQAGWMLSMSGAIFLFACLGSGGIPGLQWIDNSYASLGLLILGVAVNLGLGSLGRKSYFASFHTLLSLVALVVVPAGIPTLFIAVVISLYAVLQTYKERWDLHILLTISGFFLYHLFWIYTLRGESHYELLRIQGVAALCLVFTAAALIHYRENYRTEKFELFPFLVHLVNWFYFSAGMIFYLAEYQWRTIPLILGALAAFLLAQKAHDKGIAWLKTTDTMITQVLTLAAFLTLMGWDMESVLIWGLIFAESILFVLIMAKQNNQFLFRVGVNLSYLAGLILMTVCLRNPGYAGSFSMAGAMGLSLFLHRTLVKQDREKGNGANWLRGDTLPWLARRNREFSLTGFLTGLQGLTLLVILSNRELPGVATLSPIMLIPALPFAALLLFQSARHYSRGLLAGALLFLAGLCLAQWNQLLRPGEAWEHMINGLSLFAAGGFSLLWIKHPFEQKYRNMTGIVIITLTLILLSMALLSPFSPFLPGLFWLCAALILLQLPKLPQNVRTMVILFVAAFLLRHFTIHLKLDSAWGFIKHRYIMEILALPVLYLWYRRKSSTHSLVFELGLVFIWATLILEVPLSWISSALGALAILFLLSQSGKKEPSRILFYTLLINWTALGGLGVAFFQREQLSFFSISGSIAVLINLGYLILFIHSQSLKRLILPPFLSPLVKLTTLLKHRINGLLLYPLTLVTALFLFGAFPADTLTLVWALECFLIFSASIFLGEEHFRYVSQGGLFLCVIRLVLVDLSGSTTLTRGMVFLGVGILMLSVNALYNRYKERFIKRT